MRSQDVLREIHGFVARPATIDLTMNAEQLKAVQTPLKERYRQDPRAALITLRAEGRASGLSCKVETGKALVEAGLHPATGGDGTAV
jgi:hypothetical protein